MSAVDGIQHQKPYTMFGCCEVKPDILPSISFDQVTKVYSDQGQKEKPKIDTASTIASQQSQISSTEINSNKPIEKGNVVNLPQTETKPLEIYQSCGETPELLLNAALAGIALFPAVAIEFKPVIPTLAIIGGVVAIGLAGGPALGLATGAMIGLKGAGIALGGTWIASGVAIAVARISTGQVNL
tara:strand:+ start:245 stop:799 length:555 start_codon:yes stop_codon:yes gene_type:complete